MPTVTKSIQINAPVKKVFDFVTKPDNWTRYVTSLVAVKDMSANIPSAGSTFNWEYKMMGLRFSGKGEVTDYAKNKSFGMSLLGRATIKESYEFIDDGNSSTTLKVKIEYEMPGEMMKMIANTKLVEKLNAMESKAVMDKIKLMCEGA